MLDLSSLHQAAGDWETVSDKGSVLFYLITSQPLIGLTSRGGQTGGAE